MERIVSRVLRCAICLAALAFALPPAQAEPGVVVQAADAPAGNSSGLEPRTEYQAMDGAKVKVLSFQNQSGALRYSPPIDWEATQTGARANFRKGKVVATLTVSGGGANIGSPTPEQLQQFGRQTAARVGTESTGVTATLLPFSLGNTALVESTVTFQRAGEPQVFQSVRTWGGSWQVQLEISGPKTEFDRVAPSFVSSVCNMEIHSASALEAQVFDRNQEAFSAAAAPVSTAPRALPASGAKIRGRLP